MTKSICPAKNPYVNGQLCELFYPFGCGARCNNLYKKWVKESEEVRKLEGISKGEFQVE